MTASEPSSVELRLPSWAPLTGAALGIAMAAPCCLWVAANVTPSPELHAVALFVHLAALLVGFGAALTVDWLAVLWLAGRRRLTHVLEAATHLTVPIWAGFAGLAFSGVFLEPALTDPLTRLKLALVVLIGVNGTMATSLHRAMVRRPTRRLVTTGVCCAGLSQLGWWGATLIGFLNAH